MLDKQTVKLLKYLVPICEDGSFKVIETTDMAKSVSRKTAPESVMPMLKFLQDYEMVDIKYSDETKICLSVLPKGRVYVETQSNKRAGITLSRRMITIAITGSFIAAFAGALLANIIFKLLGL